MTWLKTLRLKSPSPEVRVRAVESLAGSTKTSDTERIVATLTDRSPHVRCAAIRALESARDELCIDSFLDALEDHDKDVRATAARALGKRQNQRAVRPLVLRLSDPSPEVRAAAAHGLRNLGWTPETREDIARFELANGNARGAAFTGNSAVTLLCEELKQDTSFHRRAAAEALTNLNDPRRVEPLLKALVDPDSSVRISAIYALETEKDERVTAALLKLFRESDPRTRLAAVQVLSRRTNTPPNHFLPLLRDKVFEIRLAAVQFLGNVRQPEITQALLPSLSDVDNDVRQATAVALGKHGDPIAIEALVVALADEDRMVRASAERSLEILDSSWPETEAARRAAAKLEQKMEQTPTWVRSSIRQVIDRIMVAC